MERRDGRDGSEQSSERRLAGVRRVPRSLATARAVLAVAWSTVSATAWSTVLAAAWSTVVRVVAATGEAATGEPPADGRTATTDDGRIAADDERTTADERAATGDGTTEDSGGPRPGPPGAWLALGSGVAFGIYSLSGFATGDHFMLAINLEVYFHAADAVLSGGDLYAVTPPDHPAYRYLYPPVVVAAFLPLSAFASWGPAFVAFTAVSVAAGLAGAAVTWRYVARHGRPMARPEKALVAAFFVGAIHTIPTLYYGNVNLVLAALVAVGFASLDRGQEATAGAALGLVALVKVFPAALGAWLVRRRAWRAVAAATATGGGLLAAGVPLFGVATHRDYVTEALLPRMRSDVFAGGLDPNAPYVTVRRPLSVLFPALDPALLSLAAGVVLAPVVLYLYTGVEGPTDRLVAVFGTVAGVLLFFPSYFLYFVYLFFPLVALLFLLPGRTARRLFVAGAVLANFAITLESVVELIRDPLVPAAVESALVDLATPLFTFATPTTWGVALMLAGCVVHRRRSGPSLPETAGALRRRVAG